jgi:plasmid stabilization system protein ParE
VIDNQAKLHLRQAYNYIKKDSLEKVRDKILYSIQNLIKKPEVHAPDKYKLNNDGSYRAYEVYKYRITYHLSKEQITVIRIRHTKMNPFEY